ncbi:MAG: TauD/TfdA family dioxygenase, partial [SAR324 cluster bacterium]|nr:TauD/TfdA family dioxygenase [SAR324 cluster bacterium]
MGIAIYPITPDFVAEIGDVDLSATLAPADMEAVREAFWKYAVLIFPDQHLSQEQHLAFAARFGPLEEGTRLGRGDRPLRVARELADVSN